MRAYLSSRPIVSVCDVRRL